MAEELSYMSKAMVMAFKDKIAEGYKTFRLKTRINNLTFYSEDLTGEYIIKKFSQNGYWLISFDGTTELQAKNSFNEWDVI